MSEIRRASVKDHERLRQRFFGRETQLPPAKDSDRHKELFRLNRSDAGEDREALIDFAMEEYLNIMALIASGEATPTWLSASFDEETGQIRLAGLIQGPRA